MVLQYVPQFLGTACLVEPNPPGRVWAILSDMFLTNNIVEVMESDCQGFSVIKDIAASTFPGSFSWRGEGAASCHVVRTLSSYSVERVRWPRTKAPGQQPYLCNILEVTPSAPVKPSDGWPASWETQSQNHPAKSLLDSWLSATTLDNKCLWFSAAEFGADLLDSHRGHSCNSCRRFGSAVKLEKPWTRPWIPGRQRPP